MKTHFALAFSMLLVSMLYASVPKPATAIETPRVPGVKAGDWATYAFSVNISSSNPNATLPPNPYAEVDKAKIEILSIESTNVTLNFILYYRNGTEYNSEIEIIDVSSGTVVFGSNLTAPDQTAGPLIGSNLTAGDQIFLNPLSGTINATTEGMYAGSQREVNNFQQELDQGDMTQNIEFYWDQTSGIMVSLNMTATGAFDQSSQLFETMMIIETNIWQPTPVPLIGDTNQDGIVDVLDLVRVAIAFGSDPTMQSWNPACDLNGDNIINIVDLAIIAANFGQTG